ncbi:MAG TPA: hypothetical protein VMS02_01430 [Solirubrobacteraceae bacterium]|nr:hypothetical protein [Solirubrobacteraceae bacterium]
MVFDETAFREDLRRTGQAGCDVALATRAAYSRAGCPIASLRACDDAARDETRLPGCVKVYLPSPAGRFGMVFAIERRRGRLLLAYLAFGVRHQPPEAHAPTVYQLAHRRLQS